MLPAQRAPYGPLGDYGSAPADMGDDLAATLLAYWHILNKRKWLILSIALAAVALGTMRTLMMTPLYTATVRLQIDRNVAKIVEGGNVTPVEEAATSSSSTPSTSSCRAAPWPSASRPLETRR